MWIRTKGYMNLAINMDLIVDFSKEGPQPSTGDSEYKIYFYPVKTNEFINAYSWSYEKESERDRIFGLLCVQFHTAEIGKADEYSHRDNV